MRRLPSFIGLALIVLAAGAAGGCRRSPPAGASASGASPAVRVQVAAVQRETVPVYLEVNGTVRAVQRATIAAKIGGPIESLAVKLGQSVRQGEVLLQISAAEYSARLAQARAQLAQVERELARERALQATGAGTADAVRALEDGLAQSRAAVREAETLVGYTTLRAPFDGVVAMKQIEAGDFAAPGAPLLRLDGREHFEIEAGLPDSAAGIAVGGTLEVELAGSGSRVRTTVTELSSAADATARTTTVRLAVPDGTPIRAGQFARVFVPSGTVSALLIPATAVSNFGQMERVFAVDAGNRASLRLVKVGAAHGTRLEIASGLDAADRVVVAPPATLRDGDALTISP